MNVKELIDMLKKEDPEKEIILQSDPEGNSFSPVSRIDGDCVYDCDDHDKVYSLKWTAEDADMDEDEWEEFKKEQEQCVVFVPLF